MRSHFNRSALVRQLTGWLPAPPEAPPRQDIAERLGEWLNVADAIALHTVHQSPPPPATPRRGLPSGAAAEAQASLQRLRGTLAQAIAQPPQLPTQAEDAGFALHHQRYMDHQRRMEMAVDALRGHLRQRLAAASPRLARLAALDATLEQMLGGREQRLLAGVPAFLKAHFEQLRQERPEDWPPLFEQALQQTLLAELDQRLQPLMGMAEALSRASTPH